MLKKELYKIIINKKTWGIWITFLIMNVFLTQYLQKNDERLYSGHEYQSLWEDIDKSSNSLTQIGMELEDTKEFLKLLHGFYYEDSKVYSQELKENQYSKEEIAKLLEAYHSRTYLKYTSNLFSEIKLVTDVLEEVWSLDGYKEYIKSIQMKTTQLTKVSIFAKENSFAYRNAKDIYSKYDKLGDVKIEKAPSVGLNIAMDSTITDLLAIFFIIFLCLYIFVEERDFGLNPLLRTNYHGRGCLVRSKISAVAVISLITGVCLYGSNFLMAQIEYGFGNFDRSIQSVASFHTSPYAISVRKFILYYFLLKLLLLLVCVFVISAFSICIKNKIIFLSIILMFGIISVCLYTVIPAVSIYSYLKYLNIVYFFQSEKLIATYFNLNFFGYPVAYSLCYGILIFIFAALSLWQGIRQYSITRKGYKFLKVLSKQRNKQKRQLLWGLSGRTVSVFWHECYKILISEKIIFVLILFATFQIIRYQPDKFTFANEDEYYYYTYMKKLAGDITVEKEQEIQKETEYFQNIQNEIEKELLKSKPNTYKLMELYSENNARDAFVRVQERFHYLKNIKQGCFVYEGGYNELIAGEGEETSDYLSGLTLVLILAICLTSVFSLDEQNKMLPILFVSRYGKGRSKNYKILIGSVITVVCLILVYLPQMIYVFLKYGSDGLSYTAASIPILQRWNNICLGEYLIILNLVRLLGGLMTSLFIYYMSWRIKNGVQTMYINLMILGCMFGLPLLNHKLRWMSFPLKSVLGNELMQGNVIMLLVYLLISFIMVGFVLKYYKSLQ